MRVRGVTHRSATALATAGRKGLAIWVALVATSSFGLAGPTGIVAKRENLPPSVIPIAVFGNDDRVLLPPRLDTLEGKIGMLYEPRSRSVCTAFCVDEQTIATAAHCLYRTRGERPLPLASMTFRLSSMGKRAAGVRIAGASRGAAAQNIMTGTTDLSTRPPIDATRDWALVRLATPACSKGSLPLVRRTPIEIAAGEDARPIYQVGYHGDFGKWQLTFSPPCTVRRPGQKEGGRVIASDFADASALILHTCDTGGASSGSPLLVDGPHGPEVVGINVGTYLQSQVLTQAGEVVHRYKSDAVANTGVSTLAFLDQRDQFARAAILQSNAEIRRVEHALSASGHFDGPIDGRYDPSLRTAIANFEGSERRPRTGLATRDLLRRLEAVLAEHRSSPSYQPSSETFETGSVPPAAKPER